MYGTAVIEFHTVNIFPVPQFSNTLLFIGVFMNIYPSLLFSMVHPCCPALFQYIMCFLECKKIYKIMVKSLFFAKNRLFQQNNI